MNNKIIKIFLTVIIVLSGKIIFSQSDFSESVDTTNVIDTSQINKNTLELLSVKDSALFNNTDSISAEVTDSVRYFTLTIHSNIENAEIYSDTLLLGKTPLDTFKMKEGSHNLKIINPKSLKDWQNNNLLMNLNIQNDTVVFVSFSYYYFINTDQYNAKVFNRDSLLGETPLRLFTDKELSGFLNLKKKNYKDYLFDLKNYDFETGAIIKLQPKGNETVNDIIYKDRSTQFKTKRPLLPIFGTTALIVTSGILAINYKNSANTDYENYLRTRNITFLNESQNNDTYFTIAIIAMQAAIGGLIYFLFFDK